MILSLLFQDPILFLIWLMAIVTAITVHEFAHAAAASLLGDPTPGSQGRVSFNPMAHIDPFGFLLLVLVGFGWGRPVQFNPYNLRNQKWGAAIVGFAGPLANIGMVILFGVLARVFIDLGVENRLFVLLISMVQINLALLLFNLLPIPPLDGSKVLFAFLPPSAQGIRIFLERYGLYLLLGLLLFGTSIFGKFFSAIYSMLVRVLFA
jgi:Zn-dependent protease